ncbi:MFS transporter [Pseudomonas sp. PA27(2017)]|nr:MFS transporter [Pseudomonas sp. PA27(2017)]
MPLRLWALFASLYTTQSLSLMFIVVTLVAILRSQGVSLEQISLIYMLGMIWPLKCLWAPLVDRIGAARRSHYKGWLLATQGSMVVVLVAMGTLDVVEDFQHIYLLCALIALLSATQDIAADGLACSLLPPASRGRGNGIQIAGGLLGTLLGAGVLLMCYPFLGWAGCTWILAAVMAVSLLQLLLFDEPQRRTPALTYGLLFARCVSFWRQPRSFYWLCVLMVYPIGGALGYALLTPILVDAGWSLPNIGLVVNVFGCLLGIAAALGSGLLIQRIGRRRAMVLAAWLQIPGVAILALPVLGYVDIASVTLAVGLYFFCYNPAATVLATLMMDRASAHSPATDYSLQFSVNQVFGMGMIGVGTALAGSLGYLAVLALAAIASALATLLASFYSEGPDT